LVAKKGTISFFRIKGKQKKANKAKGEIKRFCSSEAKNLFLSFKNEKCEAK
jgi:hypothetical protein